MWCPRTSILQPLSLSFLLVKSRSFFSEAAPRVVLECTTCCHLPQTSLCHGYV